MWMWMSQCSQSMYKKKTNWVNLSEISRDDCEVMWFTLDNVIMIYVEPGHRIMCVPLDSSNYNTAQYSIQEAECYGSSSPPPPSRQYCHKRWWKPVFCKQTDPLCCSVWTPTGDAANTVTNSSEVMRLKQKPQRIHIPNYQGMLVHCSTVCA